MINLTVYLQIKLKIYQISICCQFNKLLKKNNSSLENPYRSLKKENLNSNKHFYFKKGA